MMSTNRQAAQQRHARAQLEQAAHEVAVTGSGARNSTLNRAAWRVGGYVAAGVLPTERAEAVLRAAALRAGLSASEARSTVASGLRAGARTPAFQRDRVSGGSSPRPRAVPVAMPLEPVVEPGVELAYQALASSLVELCPVGGDVERYLESRGLPTDVVDVFGLPPEREQGPLVAELGRRHGRAALIASGMFDDSCTRLLWSAHRLALIWRDAVSGDVAAVQRRYLGTPPSNVTKTVFARGRSPSWPWGSHLLATVPRSAPVTILEGALDAIAWRVLHPFEDAAPCIALPSATPLRAEWLPMLAGREVFVALDSDAAGEVASAKIIEQLKSCARPLRIKPWPGHKDWCERVERTRGHVPATEVRR